MRILHVIDSDGLYGAEMVVLALMQEHAMNGQDVELASIAEPGVAEKAIEAEARRRGLRWQRFELKKGLDLKGIYRICRYAQDADVSIIHSHGYKANILLALTSRKRRVVPVVATLHGWLVSSAFNKMRAYQWIECAVLPRLDYVVAVCRAMTRGTLFARRLGARLTVIHNGIPAIEERSSDGVAAVAVARDQLNKFAAGRPLAFMVGRLSPEKNLLMAFRAVQDLKRRGNPIAVVVFGEGGDYNSLHGYVVSHELEQDIWLFGYCDIVAELMQAASVLLMTSKTEGVPIVLLEALRAGVPVVSTSVGGIPEIIDDGSNGLLVASDDARELSEKIERLIVDASLRALIADEGIIRFKTYGKIDGVAARYLDVYEAA